MEHRCCRKLFLEGNPAGDCRTGWSGLYMTEQLLNNHWRWKAVRTKITLACTECKQRNYNMTKDKKTHPERMETKKYCRFCKRHTLHKETK